MPAGYSGCAWWRFRLPMRMLANVGCDGIDMVLADNPNKTVRLEDIQRETAQSDLIAMQSPGSMDGYHLMLVYKALGKKVVLDYDDMSFDLSPMNPRYADLGIRECEMLGSDGKPIYSWKDGQNGFNLKANIAKYESFLACLRAADLVTTTTDFLAGKFRKDARRVAVLTNSISLDLWRPIRRPQELGNQIRIGWFGGDSHGGDIAILKTVIPEVIRRHQNARLVIQAPHVPFWGPILEDIPPGNLEWHGWADLRTYTLMLASRHFDIGLCPLEDTEFNRCKSNIKWLEFTALGVPVVAQNMIPYSNTIKEGETGLLAGNTEEWISKICRLIEDKDLRASIREAAMADVRARYDLAKNCMRWRDTYIDLLEGRI